MSVNPVWTEPVPQPSRSARFRATLESPGLSFLMEAHDGISARIVEEAGFAGIWASGLTVSAALGVRDSNEASWTQVLDVLEFMSDASTLPILLDGDTGYGNFNNFRRLVRKLCQRRIAAVCIEDKLFPKTNSFVGEGQPLADVAEFCGKIKAGKDGQSDDEFCVIARVEALIAGRGMAEALNRAEAYHAAGADGILIHSKKAQADEILEFSREWAGRAPLVIVPTKYYATPTQAFRQAGIDMVIWANHNLRAAIQAMREVSGRIARDESLIGIEAAIAPLEDVFALTDNQELVAAERRYLEPATPTSAVVLAASRGQPLGALTEDKPKCMVDVRGRPLLHRLVATLRDGGVGPVTVVRGYAKQAVDAGGLGGVDYLDNDAYAETGEARSLACAADRLTGPSLVSYGDILFRRFILDGLMAAEGDIVLAVDAHWRGRPDRAAKQNADLVTCSRPFTGNYLADSDVQVVTIGEPVGGREAHGEWIGLARLTAAGAARVGQELAAMAADGSLDRAGLPELWQRLVEAGEQIDVLYVAGHWLDVNDAFDLAQARNFL